MKPYSNTQITQYGLVEFIYDETNQGLTSIKVNNIDVTNKIPAKVLKQTTRTILNKLGTYLPK